MINAARLMSIIGQWYFVAFVPKEKEIAASMIKTYGKFVSTTATSHKIFAGAGNNTNNETRINKIAKINFNIKIN